MKENNFVSLEFNIIPEKNMIKKFGRVSGRN